MLKRITLPILIVAMVIQILTPVAMIGIAENKTEKIISEGTEYKFQIQLSNVNDGVVHYRLLNSFMTYALSNDFYFLIEVDEYGFAHYKAMMENIPANGIYVSPTKKNSNAFLSCAVDTELEYIDFDFLSSNDNESLFGNTDESSGSGISDYIVVKIYEGDVVVTGVYIDNVPIIEWLEINATNK